MAESAPIKDMTQVGCLLVGKSLSHPRGRRKVLQGSSASPGLLCASQPGHIQLQAKVAGKLAVPAATTASSVMKVVKTAYQVRGGSLFWSLLHL